MATGKLSIPKCGGGHLQFNRLVCDYGGVELVSRDFRVAPELVKGWMSGTIDIPRTAMLALWWQSNHGFDQAFRESHWTHSFMCFLRNQARDRVELLERLIVQAGYAVPPGRIMTDAEMARIPSDGWQAHVTTVERPPRQLEHAHRLLPPDGKRREIERRRGPACGEAGAQADRSAATYGQEAECTLLATWRLSA